MPDLRAELLERLPSTPQTTEGRSSLRLAVAGVKNVQVRDASATGDGSWTIEGYSAVFDQETTLYDIPGWVRVREEIAPTAFDDVMERLSHGVGLVHLNHGHDMKTAIAATNVRGIGALELGVDFHGQRMFARVDPDDPDARSLASKMRNRVVAQSSFAFTIGDEEIVDERELEDGTLDIKFRINKIQDQYDVCVCAQGAYPTTESYLRSLSAASLRVPDPGMLGRTDPVGQPRRDSESGETSVAPVGVGGLDVNALRAKGVAALLA
jgi:HK97 family phage prohead protease